MAEAPDLPEEFPRSWWDTNNDSAFEVLDLIEERGATEHGKGPRGLPVDVSDEVAAFHHADPEPLHTTWLGFEEVLSFDWNAKEERRTLLISDGNVRKRHLDPDAARRHVAQWGIEHVPRGWMAVRAHSFRKALEVPVTWHEQRNSIARSFMPVLVDLVKLERRPDVDAVRTVFWFDA